MHQYIKFILFWIDTNTVVFLLASSHQYLFDKCLLLYVQSRPHDGWKDRLKHVEEFQSKKKLIH